MGMKYPGRYLAVTELRSKTCQYLLTKYKARNKKEYKATYK